MVQLIRSAAINNKDNSEKIASVKIQLKEPPTKKIV